MCDERSRNTSFLINEYNEYNFQKNTLNML